MFNASSAILATAGRPATAAAVTGPRGHAAAIAAPSRPSARSQPASAFADQGHIRQGRRAQRAVVSASLLVLAGVLGGNSLATRHHDATIPEARLAGPPATRLLPQTTIAAVTGHGYHLTPPPGWQDRTVDLAGRVGRARADLVLTGRVTNGFASTITVIHTPAGSGQVPLTQVPRLVGHAIAQAPHRRQVTTTLNTIVAGEPAVGYDFEFLTENGIRRGRQLVVDHATTGTS